MIWTEREPSYLPMGSEATRDYQRRWVIAMLERRAELARMESAALSQLLVESDAALAEKSNGDTPLGHVLIEALLEAFENLAYVRQQLADTKQLCTEIKWECRNLEAERDEARRELAEARCDSLSVDLDAERGACNDAKAERDEARRELEQARYEATNLRAALDAATELVAEVRRDRDEERRELDEARRYGPKWWPSDEEIEDGWEETEFYDNDFSHVLIFVVPPAPLVRRALERKEGA